MGFHSGKWWMIEDSYRLPGRSNEWKLIDVKIERQVHFAIGSFDVGRKELGLQIEKLTIERNAAARDVFGMDICKVACRIQIACFPNPLAIGANQNDVEPELRLGTERAAWQVVSRIQIGNAVFEFERRADFGSTRESWSVDLRTVFHDLSPQVFFVIQLLQIRGDDFPRVEAVVDVAPSFWKRNLNFSVGDLAFVFLSSPTAAPIELQPLFGRPSFVWRC